MLKKMLKGLNKLKSFKTPLIISILLLIAGFVYNYFFNINLPLIPLTIIAFLSSLISCYCNNRTLKKLHKSIKKLTRGGKIESNESYFNENKYYNKLFMTCRHIIDDSQSLENKLSTSADKISNSFENAYSLSENSNEEIGSIFGSLDDISTPVNQQAEELQLISNKIEHLSEYIDSVHDNFGNILSGTEKINSHSSAGLDSVGQLQKKFGATSQVFDEISTAIKDFTSIINNINEFVDIISDIGTKTSLLALNASIEASRAGSAGQGFLVVADQFKNLSAQTEEYTDDISKLINNVSQQYNVITKKIEQLSLSIEEQKNSVHETDKVFNEIANSLSTISREMNGVNTSLDKMTEHKDEVFGLIEDTAALSEETAASSENFASTIAYHMQTVTNIFNAIKDTEEQISNLNKKI